MRFLFLDLEVIEWFDSRNHSRDEDKNPLLTGLQVTKEKREPNDKMALEKRFEFGKNWARFLKGLDKDRIAEAKKSLQEMFGMKDLSSKRFLDVGSGSGSFSLAARSLGASVHSFD